MVKSNIPHIGGNKGNTLTEHLKSTDLEKIMIVPIEIGKSFNKALLADYFGSIYKEPFQFHNSREGISFLHNTISKASQEHKIEKIILALEATGHYYQKPAASIYEQGYKNLFVLNPLSTAQCRKAGLTWSKDDDVDLCAIGQGLLSGYGTIYRTEKPVWENLRQICRYRRFQVNHQTALKNKIHAVLDSLLPGISELQMFKDPHLWHQASLEFITRYASIAQISRLKPAYIVKFFSRHGRRLSPEDAHNLLAWTKQALNPQSSVNSTRQDILQSLILDLKHLCENIRKLEISILGYLVQTPAALLLTIDYIGPIRAAEFAGELTPLDQYPTSRALIKGAGLDATRKKSVLSESKNHPISKKGSRNLRYITVDIADALMKHNDYFSQFADNLIDRGKSKDCACIATATRFMRVAFSMLKNEQSFLPANGLGISKNPLAKIELFLSQRQASDSIKQYTKNAQKYLKPSKGGSSTQTQ